MMMVGLDSDISISHNSLVENEIDWFTKSQSNSNCVMKSCLNKKSGINVCHLNINSIVHKLDQLKDLLRNVQIDVICVTETYLKSHNPNAAYELSGFKMFRLDRTSCQKGGILIYVNNNITCKIVFQLMDTTLETICLQLTFNQHKIFLGTFYKRPKFDCSDILDKVMSEYGIEYDEIIITGDFNYNMLCTSSKVRKFRSLLYSHICEVINKEPTCFPYYRNSSQLDLIVCNNDHIKLHNQISLGFSDHDIVFCNYDCISETKSYYIMTTVISTMISFLRIRRVYFGNVY